MSNETIRIGFCENGAGYGGAVISLAAYLENIQSEFTPHIFTGIGTDAYQGLDRVGAWRHMPPTNVIDLRWMKRRGTPFTSTIDNLVNLLPYALRYYRAFQRERINLVYLNNDASCNMAAAIAGKMAGLPLVLHARGFHSDTKGNRWVLSNVQHCIAVSQAVKAELIELGLPPEKCTVVAEGLNLNLFQPRPPAQALRDELGLNGGEPILTLVGGLIDWKGQDVLLDAAPMIFEQFPDAQILLVGSAYGKDDRYANIIAAAASPFGGRVRLLGNRPDIPEILSISSVVLHASTSPEPFGRTFLEGMALGRPVVASNEGGPLDVIEDGVDGLLIAPREPHILADAIHRILSDPAFAARLGTNAARKALHYSIEHHASAVGAVLRQAIRSTNRHS
jgi:glycosyltransferase involved in cell wall biosynthesis